MGDNPGVSLVALIIVFIRCRRHWIRIPKLIGKKEEENAMWSRLIALLAVAFFLAPTVPAQNMNEDFLAAARKGDVAKLKELLDKGVDVNTKTQYGATALAYACDKGHFEVVKLLLERGANVNVKDTFYGEMPLGWALQKENVEILRLLLEKGAEGGDRVLMYGVRANKVEIVKVALDKGGLKPGVLSSALGAAESSNHAEIVELLKKAGAVAKTSFPVDLDTLKSYTGVYKQDVGEFTFTLNNGKLIGRFGGQSPVTLAAVDKTTFTLVELDGFTIKFNLEGDKVVSVTLKQPGFTGDFKRVDPK